MANAIAIATDVYPQNGNVAVYLKIAFSGSEFNGTQYDGGVQRGINVEWPATSTLAQIKTIVTTAIANEAATLGIAGLTIPANNMQIPSFQKG